MVSYLVIFISFLVIAPFPSSLKTALSDPLSGRWIGPVFYQMNTRATRTVESEDRDVRFVFEWFGLSGDHKANMEHSYNPDGSWSGDYMRVFAARDLPFTSACDPELTVVKFV